MNAHTSKTAIRHSFLPGKSMVILAGGVAIVLFTWALTSVQTQIALLGIGLASLAAWLVAAAGEPRHNRDGGAGAADMSGPVPPHSSATENQLIWETAQEINGIARIADPLLRQYALARLASAAEEFRALASGRLVFANTETWRAAYEKVLANPAVSEYRSVSWVKTADYWQDTPGQQSMKLNYELIGRGVRIERILIVGENLWATGARLPSTQIREWMDGQHYRGIWIGLARESDLLGEPDLLRDWGIYGSQAAGEQELDERGGTERFVLSFDQPSIRLAQDRWERLLLFAVPYISLLDQTGTDR